MYDQQRVARHGEHTARGTVGIPLQGLLPNDFANRVKVSGTTAWQCPALVRQGHLHDAWPRQLQIAELNRHIDNMHQREEEYRRRVQVRA
jgi:hypothetical protein